jgi:hypothetical protein
MTLLIQLTQDPNTGESRTIEFPVLSENFRMLHPNISFPAMLTPDIVEPYGFGIYDYSPVPAYNQNTHKLIESNPVRNADGIWLQQWMLVELTEEERIARRNDVLATVRQQRNFRLSMSDWTQLPDAPMSIELKEKYKIYRQELRDLIDDTLDPYNFSWPLEPSTFVQTAPQVI